VYALTVDQDQVISSSDWSGTHTYHTSFGGDVTTEVASYNHNRFTRALTYTIDDGSASFTIDSGAVTTVWYTNADLQQEKFDNRGFSREDIVSYADFDALCTAAGTASEDNKPFLSGLFLLELPPDAMQANDTWTSSQPIFEDFTNHPTIGIKWTLLSEAETRQGVSCAKYKVEIVDGTFSNVTKTITVPNVGDVTNRLDCTEQTMTATLWFDTAGGKIVEWSSEVHTHASKQQDHPEDSECSTAATTTISYIYSGTR